jgi:hypothetical protein
MVSMLSVPAFLAEHGISRSLFYRLVKEGRGPRLTKINGRTLISVEAAAGWRTRMERETQQPGPPPIPNGGHGRRGKRGAIASAGKAA